MKYSPVKLDRRKFEPEKLYMISGVGWGGPSAYTEDMIIVGYEGIGEVRIPGFEYQHLHRFIADGKRDFTRDLEELFCSVMDLLRADDALILEEN